ncbi:MAG: hypothetical protein JEY91_10085 [Spirochaetaceae bacterium]|nr:hypothetical protein [Spirochaetaceae bacterium]
MKKIFIFLSRMNKMILYYFSFFAILAIVVLISSREIIMTPWTAREWISATAESEHIYISGGTDSDNRLCENIFHIDLEKKTIKTIGNLPTPRYSTVSAYKEPYVYIAGGCDNEGYLDEIVRFNPHEKISDIYVRFDEPRCYGAMVNIGNSLYYIGGFNGKEVVDTILKINTDTGKITETSKLKTPINFHSSVALNGNILIIGGENDKGNRVTDIYEIDPETGEILRSGNLPVALIRSTASLWENQLYIVGGWGEGGSRNEIIRVDLNDPVLTSEIIGYLPQKSSDKSLISYGSELFLIGGAEERFLRQIKVIKYKPESGFSESLKLQSYPWWH